MLISRPWRTALLAVALCACGRQTTDDAVDSDDPLTDDTDPEETSDSDPSVVDPPDVSGWLSEIGADQWTSPNTLEIDGETLEIFVSSTGGPNWTGHAHAIFCELDGGPHLVLPDVVDDASLPMRMGAILALEDDGSLRFAGMLSDRAPIAHNGASTTAFVCADLDRDGYTDLVVPTTPERPIYWGRADGGFDVGELPLDQSELPPSARLPASSPRHVSIVHMGGEPLPSLLFGVEVVGSQEGLAIPVVQVSPRRFVPMPELLDAGRDVRPYFQHRVRLLGPDGGTHQIIAAGDIGRQASDLVPDQYSRIPTVAGDPADALSAWRWVPEDRVPDDASFLVVPGIPQTVGILSGVSPMAHALTWRPDVDRPVSIFTSTAQTSPAFDLGAWGSPVVPWSELSRRRGGSHQIPLVLHDPADDESYMRWWGMGGDAELLLVAGGHDGGTARARRFPHNEWSRLTAWWTPGDQPYTDLTEQAGLADIHGSFLALSAWVDGRGRHVWGVGSGHFPAEDPSRPVVVQEHALPGERTLGVVLSGRTSLPRGRGSWVSLMAEDGEVLGRAAVGGFAQPLIGSAHGVRFRVAEDAAIDHLEVWWEGTDLVQEVPISELDTRIEVVEPVEVQSEGVVVAGADVGTWTLRVTADRDMVDDLQLSTSGLALPGAPTVQDLGSSWEISVPLPAASALSDVGPPSWPAKRFGALLGRVSVELQLIRDRRVVGRVGRRVLLVDGA